MQKKARKWYLPKCSKGKQHIWTDSEDLAWRICDNGCGETLKVTHRTPTDYPESFDGRTEFIYVECPRCKQPCNERFLSDICVSCNNILYCAFCGTFKNTGALHTSKGGDRSISICDECHDDLGNQFMKAWGNEN